jgi:AraC family transcriptional regulator of arabinose operon
MSANPAQSLTDFFAGPPLRYVTGFSHTVGGQGQRHGHDSIEIVYHRRGGGRIEVAGRTIVFSEGAAVITPAGTPHQQWNHGPGEDVCLLLRPVRPLPSALKLPLHIPRLPRRWLHHELSHLADDGEAALAATAPSWSYRATAVFAELVAAASAVQVPSSPGADPRLARVRDHIATHYREPIALGDLARLVGLSPDRLRHLFVAEMGIGIAAWTRDLRINRAKDLLAHAPVPLAEVARQCGLGTDRYFSQVFRTATGMTPGAFRRHLAVHLAGGGLLRNER